MKNATLRVRRLSGTARLPSRATAGSAGYDLFADGAPVTIAPGETAKVHTGIAVELPGEDVAGLVFGRSGLCTKHGLVPANAVGVIDSDYRGEVLVVLRNHGAAPYTVAPGDRVAQLVLVPVLLPTVEEAQALSGTGRGAGGLGSTGR